MESTSRKPLVVTRAVVAPFRSIRALATRVVPWTTSPISGPGTSCSSRTRPLSTAIEGSPGVVSSFALATTVPERISTRSVNVPPMSTATRAKPTGLLPLLVRPATAPFYRINEVMGDRTPGESVNVVETESGPNRSVFKP